MPQRDAKRRLDLRGLTAAETEELVTELGYPRYRADQLWRWVHTRRAQQYDDMGNVPVAVRTAVAERADLTTLRVDRVQTSADGTRKLRLVTGDGSAVESVLIPDGDKVTQCVSSQVGCALDCQFCATARLGLMRNLTPGEIVDQVYRGQEILARADERPRISNLVFMGMGEPLHNFAALTRALELLTEEHGANFSYRRITVSTAGLVPGIRKLGSLARRPNLAVSLNATTDEVRDEVMPINRRFPIADLLAALRSYPLEPRRRITFEYVLLAGINDSDDDARRLGQLLRGMRCKVNLIPFNPHPGAPYRRPEPVAIERFQERVLAAGLSAYLRTPRGDDIDAACGQLADRGPTNS